MVAMMRVVRFIVSKMRLLVVRVKKCFGGTLYLVGYRTENHDYEEGAAPCLMCRKLIINSGIEKVIVRKQKREYVIYNVQDWIENDEYLEGKLSY